MLDLSTLGLTAEQREKRRFSLGGSDANILMSGDQGKIHYLWLVKTGQKESDDLSSVLPVIMGTFTEPLNLAWFHKMTGRPVTRCGESVRHPEHGWMHVTLDGMTSARDSGDAVIDAKHVNAFSDIDEVVQKYIPQLMHGMACCGVQRSVLSVFIGTLKYEFAEVDYDWLYAAKLLDREQEFWSCVQEGVPPGDMPLVQGVQKVAAYRSIDLTGDNEMGLLIGSWLDTLGPFKQHKLDDEDIKARIPPDVGLATGYGVEIKRAKIGKEGKPGAITIKPAAETKRRAA